MANGEWRIAGTRRVTGHASLFAIRHSLLPSRRTGRTLAKRGLRRRKARDRHAERRTRDVVEPDLVAEGDRGRIAAMLAADAELQSVARLAAAIRRDADQFAD